MQQTRLDYLLVSLPQASVGVRWLEASVVQQTRHGAAMQQKDGLDLRFFSRACWLHDNAQ